MVVGAGPGGSAGYTGGDALASASRHLPSYQPQSQSQSQSQSQQFVAPESPARRMAAIPDPETRNTSFRPINAPSQLAIDHRNNPQDPTRSAPNSQSSTMTSASDQVFSPPISEASTGGGGASGPLADGLDSQGRPQTQESGHLLQLSALAAAQDKMVAAGGGDVPVSAGGARKRMADGEVKNAYDGGGGASPTKGHSRNTSAISTASTTTSTIGDLSAELKTRLSYAMVKVHNGWQSHTFDQVESMASQAVSPTSSTSTAHRRNGSSASPRLPMNATAAAQVHFANDPASSSQRRKSDSPPFKSFAASSSKKPALAPPATIQPSGSMPAPNNMQRRRNSNPRYTPTMLSHSHSASPHTPATASSRPTMHPLKTSSQPDPIMYSPHQHQNVREQDAIETLMFMRSPNNSANLKHSFSPNGSPGPGSQNDPAPRSTPGRHALPSGPRKMLPTERPVHTNAASKAGYDHRSPAPDSPMDLDSPQQQHLYHTPNSNRGTGTGTPRRRVNGASSHLRGALSLPTGLGVGPGAAARRTIRDEDIESMLDRAGAEAAESSDEDEIQIPRGRTGVAGVGV